MANLVKAPVTRRQALRRGAAAGAVIWTTPMIISSTAHASGGSNGSKTDGKVDSVTCVWNQRYFRPRRGTPSQPGHDYSGDSFCEINVGRGWQILARNEQFVLPYGQVLQFRPFSSHSGGRTAEPVEAAPETTAAPATTAPPTTAPPTTAPPTTAPPTTAPPSTAPQNVPAPETGDVTNEPPPPKAPTTTAAVAPAPTTTVPAEPEVPALAPLPEAQPVDTIVVDMSGRGDLSIGDVFGYFQIVDADPA